MGGVQSGERCGIVTLQEFVRPKKQRHILTRLMTNCFCSFLVLVLPFLRTSLPLVRTPFIDLAARPPPVICSSRQPHPQSTNVPFEPPLRITQQSHHTSLSNDYTTAHFLPFLPSSIPPSLPPSFPPPLLPSSPYSLSFYTDPDNILSTAALTLPLVALRARMFRGLSANPIDSNCDNCDAYLTSSAIGKEGGGWWGGVGRKWQWGDREKGDREEREKS